MYAIAELILIFRGIFGSADLLNLVFPEFIMSSVLRIFNLNSSSLILNLAHASDSPEKSQVFLKVL